MMQGFCLASLLGRFSVVRVKWALLGLPRVLVFMLAGFLLVPTQAWADNMAEPQTGADIIQFLEAIQAAARDTDYEGVFTYQQGAQLKSLRLAHLVDGTGERERLEALDGAPREFLRHNDVVQCLVPEKKLVLVQPQRTDRFPGFLLDTVETLPDYYSYSVLPEASRVAGRECKVVEISPTDTLRYGYRLCIDLQSNLLLKVQTLDAERNVVDQIAFTSLTTGPDTSAVSLDSSWNTTGWKVIDTVPVPVEARARGWHIALPPGFSLVAQLARPLKSGDEAVQFVLNDGLAVISLFLEPHQQGGTGRRWPLRQSAADGATAVYRGRIADYWATAIGEVPAETVRDLVELTEFLPESDSVHH